MIDINNIIKHKLNFNTNKYSFKEQIEKVFDTKDLSLLHQSLDYECELLDNVALDQSTDHHKKYYENIDNTLFYSIYQSFMREQIRPLFNEAIIYQKIPTFRVQLPNNFGVAAFHKDKDYSHYSNEINIFLPMTEAKDTNTIWTESEEDKGDFSPLEASYGDYYIWDGANLNHGNKANVSGKTRVSVDFRFIPYSEYKASNKVSTGIQTKMILGEYFEVLK
jgi:hypothetical protein